MDELQFLIADQDKYDELPNKNDKTFYKTQDNLYIGNQQLNNAPMKGATKERDGKEGAVPQPKISDMNKFLKGDGTWEEIPSSEGKKNVFWASVGDTVVVSTPKNIIYNPTEDTIGLQWELEEDVDRVVITAGKFAISLDYPTNNYEIIGLTPDTTYKVKFQCFDTDNNPSDIITIEISTLEVNLPTPTIIKAEPGIDKVTLSFSVDSSTPILNIGWYTTNPKKMQEIEIDSSLSEYTITGLQMEVEYTFVLRGKSENGYYSNPATVKSKTIKYTLYSFTINLEESNPKDIVKYEEDNKNFRPAFMNFNTDTFDYGDWGDAWFIKETKPCILNFDGSVYKYLSKNNFNYDENNLSVGNIIIDTNKQFNVMIEFPKIYYKIISINNINEEKKIQVYISNIKLDEEFIDYSYYDADGNEIDHFYIGAYKGIKNNGKIRSISNFILSFSNNTANMNFNEIKTLGEENNLGSSRIWSMGVFSDIVLINLLLILIGKSTDVQSVFGKGLTEDINATTGTFNNKGFFYGSKNTNTSVKVFGIENYWSHIPAAIAGFVKTTNNRGLVKMTYSKVDGSTTNGYNENGDGYTDLGSITSKNNIYSDKLELKKGILIPTTTSSISKGSSSTYFCDKINYSSQSNKIFTFGASSITGNEIENCGIFNYNLYLGAGDQSPYGLTTFLSCKPMKKEGV